MYIVYHIWFHELKFHQTEYVQNILDLQLILHTADSADYRLHKNYHIYYSEVCVCVCDGK